MNLKRILRLAFWMVILGSLVVAVRGRAQTPPTGTDRWVGLWQGEVQGVPHVVLTLSDDLESPGGTIVFTAFGPGSTKEHPNIVGHEVRAILHSEVNGNTLLFQVKGIGEPEQPHGNDIHADKCVQRAARMSEMRSDAGRDAPVAIMRSTRGSHHGSSL